MDNWGHTYGLDIEKDTLGGRIGEGHCATLMPDIGDGYPGWVQTPEYKCPNEGFTHRHKNIALLYNKQYIWYISILYYL